MALRALTRARIIETAFMKIRSPIVPPVSIPKKQPGFFGGLIEKLGKLGKTTN